MGRTAGAVSLVALLAVVGTWATSTLVTKAAVGERGSTIADRLPADFIQAPDKVDPRPVVAANADRLAGIADCGAGEWPFLAPECFVATSPSPTRQAARTVARENSPEPAMRMPAVALPSVPAMAPPTCKQNLVVASARLEGALARLKGRQSGNAAESCAAYRRDFFDVVKAREVTALCKTGAERDQQLDTIDLAVESINGAIAQTCGG